MPPREMPPSTRELLTEIDAFLQRTGLKESAVGNRAVSEGAFVKRLRGGSRVFPETAERVRKWMADYEREHPQRIGQAVTKGRRAKGR